MIDKTIPCWETLLCLFLHGPTYDGNVPSKSERDDAVSQGLVKRGNGFQWLTEEGMRLCIKAGYCEEKERREAQWRKGRTNAARYEWLKAHHLQLGPDCWIRSGDDLDEAIDAEMRNADNGEGNAG